VRESRKLSESMGHEMYCLYGDASADLTDKENGAGPIRLPKQVSRNSERADLAGIMEGLASWL
jgi:hypothetical protein